MVQPTDRVRKRRDSLRLSDEDRTEIVSRVLGFEETDRQEQDLDREARLQRYAKFRMWTEGKDWPWPNSSDSALPDMMEKSLRVQDTLHNAVMSQRPAIGAKALHKTDDGKVKAVDDLIDYQVFVEQSGEEAVGELADAFVNDGVYTAFIPWVKEKRGISDARIFGSIPDELAPAEYFSGLLSQSFPAHEQVPKENGWDWTLEPVEVDGERFGVKFYTLDDERVEMVSQREVVVFDGPRLIVKDYDDVLAPSRAANLQMPSPSNPNGAAHVILVDRPTVDEITRLARSGFYDLVSKDELDSLGNTSRDDSDEGEERQKDTIAGKVEDIPPKQTKHKRLTRLICFDIHDIDGDGIAEDVIWWVLKDTKTLLKAKHLTEMYPANPPRRPLVSKSLIPIRGRWAGISLLEMMEGMHDLAKQIFDQTIDNGTIRNVPFFFYRPTGSIKPEAINLYPGEGYPLNDPQRDVKFPDIPGNDSSGLNMLAIIENKEDRLTMIGDLQLGRVPAGRSSALRTVGGMALLSGQGEARPERILRRFFMGLTEIWSQIHDLNQHFLPKDKQYRISGVQKPSEDPYQTITDTGEIEGRFQFDFRANVLNTSKATLQQSLTAFGQTFVTQLALEFGITKPEGLYRFQRDFGNALGLDPDRYISEPVPGAARPKIMAEEAITAIMQTQIPDGEPEEGAALHLQKLQEFFDSDEFGLLDPPQVEIFKGYTAEIVEKAKFEQEQARLQQAANDFRIGEGQPGRPPERPPETSEQPQISGSNELLDESLPGARGEA